MARHRYQEGFVEETGKQIKKWKGHYFVYQRQPDGSEKRVHRAIILGLKAQMRKHQAETNLKAHIEKETKQETGTITQASPALTVRWFFEERFRPMREANWRGSSRKELIANIDRYVLRLIGDTPLVKLNKFDLQMHANRLAGIYSDSVVEKYLTWTKAILEEAVDQDFIPKNPARGVTKPLTRETDKTVASQSDIRLVIQCMDGKVRVALMVSLVLGLRPSELLALRWDDVFPNALRIDEAARYGLIEATKTKASKAMVWVPKNMQSEIDSIRPRVYHPRDFIFPNKKGGVFRLDNFRNRTLRPGLRSANQKAESLGLISDTLEKLTFQICRRTCATLMQKHGGVKDIQAHLRHAQASTTLNVYVQEIPASVKAAVSSLYEEIFGFGQAERHIQ